LICWAKSFGKSSVVFIPSFCGVSRVLSTMGFVVAQAGHGPVVGGIPRGGCVCCSGKPTALPGKPAGLSDHPSVPNVDWLPGCNLPRTLGTAAIPAIITRSAKQPTVRKPPGEEDPLTEQLKQKAKQALEILQDLQVPAWQRLDAALQTYSGLELTPLCPEVRTKVELCFLDVQAIFEEYDLKTAEDYRSLSASDSLAAIRRLRQLSRHILGPRRGRREADPSGKE
jgi:hypothetical protein